MKPETVTVTVEADSRIIDEVVELIKGANTNKNAVTGMVEQLYDIPNEPEIKVSQNDPSFSTAKITLERPTPVT